MPLLPKSRPGLLPDRTQDAARRLAESEQAVAARQLTAAQVTKLGPHLRQVIDLDDERPLTPETLLLAAVVAVHDDEVSGHSRTSVGRQSATSA